MIEDYWHFWHTKPVLDSWDYQQLSKSLSYSVPQFEQLEESEREDWIIKNICRDDKSAVIITEFEDFYKSLFMLKADPSPIPEYIDGSPVRVIGEDAFRYYERIDGHHCMLECNIYPDLILPEHITYISPKAFYNQKKLQTIALPDSLMGIGVLCFADSGLKEIALPNSVEWVSAGMFHNCFNLQSVKLGGQTISIKDDAFNRCSALKSLQLPTSLKEIGERAFSDSGLEIALLPQGLEKIGKEAFAGCQNLRSCFVPNSVTSIGDDAFKNTSPDFVLMTPKYSYAQRWANLNGYKVFIFEL